MNKMRELTEFMLWNHIFFVFELARSLMYEEYLLFIFGCITTGLSYYRHLYNEDCCNTCEPFIAKFTVAYMSLVGLWYFDSMDLYVLFFNKCLLLLIWKIECINYELIHPWLHIVMAMDTHYYVSCWQDVMISV